MRPEMRYSDTRWSGWGEQLHTPQLDDFIYLHAGDIKWPRPLSSKKYLIYFETAVFFGPEKIDPYHA